MYTATYHSTDKQYNTADDEEREITEKKYLFDDDNILFLFLSFSIFVPLSIIDWGLFIRTSRDYVLVKEILSIILITIVFTSNP